MSRNKEIYNLDDRDIIDSSNFKEKIVYIYHENNNTIYKVKTKIIPKKLEKELKELGRIPYISLEQPFNKDLCCFVRASTLKKCKNQIKKYYSDRIKHITICK